MKPPPYSHFRPEPIPGNHMCSSCMYMLDVRKGDDGFLKTSCDNCKKSWTYKIPRDTNWREVEYNDGTWQPGQRVRDRSEE